MCASAPASWSLEKISRAYYESIATVGEIRVYWRADFQSGSRVLKKVFWTFSYLYLWHTMWFHAKKLLRTLKFWKSLNSLYNPEITQKIAKKRISQSRFALPQHLRPSIVISPIFGQDVRTERAQYNLRGYDFLKEKFMCPHFGIKKTIQKM